MIEDIIAADEPGEKTQGQDTMSPTTVRTGLPRVLATYPVISFDKCLLVNAQRKPKKLDGCQ